MRAAGRSENWRRARSASGSPCISPPSAWRWWRPEGRWLGVNPALCEIVGYSEAEMLAIDMSIASPSPTIAGIDAVASRRHVGARDRLLPDQQAFRAQGRARGVDAGERLAGLAADAAKPHYFIYQIQDITDRRTHRARAARQRGALSHHRRSHAGVDLGNRSGRHLHLLQPGRGGHPGLPPADLVGKNCLDMVAPNTRQTVVGSVAPWRRRKARLARLGAASQALRPAAFAGWTTTPCRCSMRTGRWSGYRGVARDITQRRLQQERIARLSRIQAVLSGINSTIVRVRDRRELFRESCRIAVQQGGFRMAWIGLVEPGALKATPLVWDGFEQGFLTEVGHELAQRARDPGAVGRAIATRRWWWSTTSRPTRTTNSSMRHWRAGFARRWPCR